MQNHRLSTTDIPNNIEEQVDAVAKELRLAFQFIQKYPHRVTIFGSAQAIPESSHAKAAEELAKRIVRDLGYTITTGGGPGIMEAANRGAREGGGTSIGLAIGLPKEQQVNQFVDDVISLDHFFIRKAILSFAAQAFVFFPGGFGTCDELFSILTLVQTRKIPRVPIILMGTDFWGPFNNFIRTSMYENHSTIEKRDMALYTITDSIDGAIEIIKKAKISEWWLEAD